jgi:hypothetical protein
MARKRSPKVKTQTPPKRKAETKADKPVRLVLPTAAFHRLERQAQLLGLTLASYARMKVMQGIAADEEASER